VPRVRASALSTERSLVSTQPLMNTPRLQTGAASEKNQAFEFYDPGTAHELLSALLSQAILIINYAIRIIKFASWKLTHQVSASETRANSF
jgi:hypothetical protein